MTFVPDAGGAAAGTVDAPAPDPRGNLVGLAAKVASADPTLPVHDLYDEVGSLFYDEIASTGYDTATVARLARHVGGPVLDLGCGSGRVGLALAQRGLAVTGLDRSEQMLARYAARLADEPQEVAARTRLIRADLHSFDLGDRFALAVLGATSIVLVDPGRRRAFFERVRAHLQGGGLFALDFFQLDLDELRRQPAAERVIELPGASAGFAVACQQFDLSCRRERVSFLVERVCGPGRVERFVVTTAKYVLRREEVVADLVHSGFALVDRPPSAAGTAHRAPEGFEWLVAQAG